MNMITNKFVLKNFDKDKDSKFPIEENGATQTSKYVPACGAIPLILKFP